MTHTITIAVHCNACRKITAHEVAAHHSRSWTETNRAGAVLDGECNYDLLLCNECQSAQLRVARRIEQLSDEFTKRYFPPHPVRVFPPWATELDPQMRGLLEQTHAALANEYLWLAAMGSRTLLDMFAVKRIGDIGGFKQKLDRLEAERFLSTKDRPVVEAALEVGHEAVHRNKPPSPEDCHAALDIVENLLHRLVIEIRAFDIRERRNPTS